MMIKWINRLWFKIRPFFVKPYKLLRCQDCGGHAEKHEEGFGIYIRCCSCGASVSCVADRDGDPTIAIERWNTRAINDQKGDRTE